MQQWTCQHQDPAANFLVDSNPSNCGMNSLCITLGFQEGVYADSIGENGLNKWSKKFQMKSDEEIKKFPKKQSSRGEVLAEQASCLDCVKIRPMWWSRWLSARGQGAGVLSESDQSPKRKRSHILQFIWRYLLVHASNWKPVPLFK